MARQYPIFSCELYSKGQAGVFRYDTPTHEGVLVFEGTHEECRKHAEEAKSDLEATYRSMERSRGA